MDVEQQQGAEDQLFLFMGEAAFVRSFAGGDAGSGSAAAGERQASAASKGNRALATDALLEKVCERENLNRAYKKVKSNRGAPGVDGMTVDELGPWLKAHREEVLQGLLEGSHQPQAVRGIEIPKPGGGMRQLGIPTVVDRWVQQAILQVLNPLFDPPAVVPTRHCGRRRST
jgi:RNA-directed DNA polymerase